MDIDPDSDLEIVSETDGNQNIEKFKRQKTTMEPHKSTPAEFDTVQCRSGPKNLKFSGDVIDLVDSDEDMPPATGNNEFNVFGSSTKHAIAPKVEPISFAEPQPSTSSVKNENMEQSDNESTTSFAPISTRTRASNRSNKVTYCDSKERDTEIPSTSYEDVTFPKGAKKSLFTIEKSQIPKNDDPTVFYSNFLYRSLCFLCGINDKKLAMHYAKMHPDSEVFIARLAPRMAEKVRKGNYNFVRMETEIHGLCFFCEEMNAFTKEKWMKHLLEHTGEQAYFCRGCETSMNRKIKHNECPKELVEHIMGDANDNTDLTGFICNTCNYLQIREEQLMKHLGEHDTLTDMSGSIYSPVVLVKVSTA